MSDKTKRGFKLKDCIDSDKFGYAPIYEGSGEEEISYCFEPYCSYYVTEHGASKEDFYAYCQKLESEGFEKFNEITAGGNLFASYTDNESAVYVSHISYDDVDKYVRRSVSYLLISVDSIKNSALPCKLEKYEKITKASFSLVNMLTFVIRLEDGRFIVIDGSVYGNTEGVLEALCQQNMLEGKPVVAAWLFSHAHGDHVGGFIGILDKYADKVIIQRVIHNFPGEDLYMPNKNYMEGIPNREGEFMSRRSRQIFELMRDKSPEGVFTIAHSGQTFEYPGVRIDVMMTSENLYRKQMFDTNMSSVVYMLTMEGGKILVTGDAVDAASKILRKIYQNDLACDAVVLAHHAYNGGDEEMYFRTGATAAIWPNYYEDLCERGLLGNYTNHFDFNGVKYNLIMSRKDKWMTLYPDMTLDDASAFIRRDEVKKQPVVDYDARRSPKNYLGVEDLEKGYGDAPRYYGLGEESERLIMDEEGLTYTVLISGATQYSFEYYCNSLKRDGYVRMEIDRGEEHSFAVYADPTNEVKVVYDKGELSVLVGKAGVTSLKY